MSDRSLTALMDAPMGDWDGPQGDRVTELPAAERRAYDDSDFGASPAAARRAILALLDQFAYDPKQPRDRKGRWTDRAELNARWVDQLVADGAATDEYGQPVGVIAEQEEPYLQDVSDLLEGDGTTGPIDAAARSRAAVDVLARAREMAFDPHQVRDAEGKWADSALSGKDAFEVLDPLSAVAARIADKDDAAMLGTAISAYGGSQHQHMNTSLRRGSGLYPGEKKFVKSIDAALAASPLPEDVEVWRGMDGGFSPQWREGSLVGAEWADPSFNSTSANEDVGKKFTEAAVVPILMRLRVPKGTGALQVGKWGKGGEGKEAEILLGRDHHYRVVADHGVVKGQRRIDVEVIPQAPKAVE